MASPSEVLDEQVSIKEGTDGIFDLKIERDDTDGKLVLDGNSGPTLNFDISQATSEQRPRIRKLPYQTCSAGTAISNLGWIGTSLSGRDLALER